MIVRPTEKITRVKQQKYFKGPIIGEHFIYMQEFTCKAISEQGLDQHANY